MSDLLPEREGTGSSPRDYIEPPPGLPRIRFEPERRDLFPLPLLSEEAARQSGLSKSVRQRLLRRQRQVESLSPPPFLRAQGRGDYADLT